MNMNKCTGLATDIIKKFKLTYLIKTYLQFVKNNPQNFTKIGIGYIDNDNDRFAINENIFSINSSRKGSSIGKNFRRKSMRRENISPNLQKKICDFYKIDSLPDPKGWKIRYMRDYNKEPVKKIKEEPPKNNDDNNSTELFNEMFIEYQDSDEWYLDRA